MLLFYCYAVRTHTTLDISTHFWQLAKKRFQIKMADLKNNVEGQMLWLLRKGIINFVYNLLTSSI